MTLERSKWQKELSVFIRLVNTIVLTGNIYDQHPIINEREQKLQGFCTLDLYLARTCQSLGYEGILLYDPVSGFRSAPYSCRGYEKRRVYPGQQPAKERTTSGKKYDFNYCTINKTFSP